MKLTPETGWMIMVAALLATIVAMIAYPFAAFTFARRTNRSTWLWIGVGLLPDILPVYIFNVGLISFGDGILIAGPLWLLGSIACLIAALRMPDRLKTVEVTLPMPCHQDTVMNPVYK